MRKECPQRTILQTQHALQQYGPTATLHHMPATLEGTTIQQGRLEAPQPSPATSARVFAITREEAAGASNVVSGQIFVNSRPAYVLFDTGATHTFMSARFARTLDSPQEILSHKFHTTLSSGEVMVSTHRCRALIVHIADRELYTDAVILEMIDYDLIIGMDFLSKYNASIECRRRRVVFNLHDEKYFVFVGEMRKKNKMFLSTLEARKLLAQGCTGFLANIVDKRKEVKTKIDEVPILGEFPEVFPEDLPGLPPDREIEFEIELVPGTNSISKAPYRMAPAELQELHKQLQELLEKGFIRPSSSP